MPFSKYSKRQKALARVAKPRTKITGADFKKLRNSTTAKKVMKKKRRMSACHKIYSDILDYIQHIYRRLICNLPRTSH